MEGNTLCSEDWCWTFVHILAFRQPKLLPAVKTGANFESSTDNLKQSQLPTLPMRDPLVKIKEGEQTVGHVLSSGSSEEVPTEAAAIVTQSSNLMEKEEGKDDVLTIWGSSSDTSDDDEDFLDLLADTLDVEFAFDPDLVL